VRPGALTRSGGLDDLTAVGWAALEAHGVRTIVDLRNADERRPGPRPASVKTVHLALDGDDKHFWDEWGTGPEFGTPLYYRPHIERFPERSARVVSAIANAGPGGVLFHCQGGRDRAGQIAMLILALLEVPPEVIADDYALSSGGADEVDIAAWAETEHGTTPRGLMVEALDGLDAEAALRAGGLTAADVAALRARTAA
jgi:protein-tyrosine phosphatase